MNDTIYISKVDGTIATYRNQTASVCVKCNRIVPMEIFGKRPKNCGNCKHAAPTDGNGGRLRAEVAKHDLKYSAELYSGILTIKPNTADDPIAYYPGTWTTFGYVMPMSKADLDKAVRQMEQAA